MLSARWLKPSRACETVAALASALAKAQAELVNPEKSRAWGALSAKNSLAAADAKLVEDALSSPHPTRLQPARSDCHHRNH
jgi:hypothetical protein